MKSCSLTILLWLICPFAFGQTYHTTYHGVYADGTAQYSYIEKANGEHILDGYFSYNSEMLNITGQYSNNLKTGKWTWNSPIDTSYGHVTYKDGYRDGDFYYQTSYNLFAKLSATFHKGKISFLNYYFTIPDVGIISGKTDGKQPEIWFNEDLKNDILYTEYYVFGTYLGSIGQYKSNRKLLQDNAGEAMQTLIDAATSLHRNGKKDGLGLIKVNNEYKDKLIKALDNQGGGTWFAAIDKTVSYKEIPYFIAYDLFKLWWPEELMIGEYYVPYTLCTLLTLNGKSIFIQP